MKIIRKIYDWMGSKVGSRHADWWLIGLFFIESSFFVIPVDPLLILYCVTHVHRAFYYASLATSASVVGGIFGYFIGAMLWQTVGPFFISWIISEATFHNLVMRYKMYEHWAVLFGAFTPIPYKAITISAGFCNLSFIPFIIFSIIGRGARFFLVAGAIRLWGAQIQYCIDRYFNYLVGAFVCLFVGSILVLK